MSDRQPNPFDPKSVLWQAFDMGAEFPGPAPDLLLSWLLSLGDGQDAVEAAMALIPVHEEAVSGLADGHPLHRLYQLLTEVAAAGNQGKPRRGHVARRRQLSAGKAGGET